MNRHVTHIIDPDLFDRMVQEGYIRCRSHPRLDLHIYNYTDNAQYEGMWNDATIQCRGLILDGEDWIIEKGFPKFFNKDEYDPGTVPKNVPYRIEEKMDGMLGILYWDGSDAYIASRGSFDSEFADVATRILHEKYGRNSDQLGLEPKWTYLFEIIAPETRIVLDYGEKRDLYLIGVFNEKGDELDVREVDHPFPVPKRFDEYQNDLEKIRSISDHEGAVVKFDNGFRMKIKTDEYKYLHSILTGINAKNIWEALRAGEDVDRILQSVPDEFYEWVVSEKNGLLEQYRELEERILHIYKSAPLRVKEGDRKTFALWAKEHPYSSALFALRDGRDYSDYIWKQIRPEARTFAEWNKEQKTES